MNKKLQYFLYIFFAALSTLINIGIQRSLEVIFTSLINWNLYLKNIVIDLNYIGINKILKPDFTYGLLIQMAIATIIAFIFKYLVDKLIIFKDKTSYISSKHLFQVFLYGFFAVFTTMIFWGCELAFEHFFIFKFSKYTGAIIGLAIGYTVKFLLDSKFVFNKKNKADN